MTTRKPNREAFVAYWKDFRKFSWRYFLFYILYPGLLGVFAFIVLRIDSAGRFWFASLSVAAAYLVLVPYFLMRRVHKNFARFIQCPNCGDWFGQDASGAYFGPNPKFKGVIETGRCSKCGEQILAD